MIITKLLGMQRELMEVLGVEVDGPQPFINNPVFSAAVIGIGKEAMECHDAHVFVGKPWKQVDEQTAIAHTKEELVDSFFMFLEACLIAGIDEEELVKIYSAKHHKNLERAAASPNKEAAARALAKLGGQKVEVVEIKDDQPTSVKVVVVETTTELPVTD